MTRAGVQPPKVEVRFENLNVECNVVVGDRGLPTVMNSYRNFVEVSYNFVEMQVFEQSHTAGIGFTQKWYL